MLIRQWTFVTVSAAVTCAVLVSLERTAATPSLCHYSVVFSNSERRVPGAVNTECSWPHTPPWGNWGVESGYSTRWDGYQFAGWRALGGWRQWNSCTGGYTSSVYFNDGWGQRADPDNINYYAVTGWNASPNGLSCQTVVSYGGLYMQLWELDQNNGDDMVGTLYYPAINIATECSAAEPWRCSGESAWVAPSSGITGIATAKIRASATSGSQTDER